MKKAQEQKIEAAWKEITRLVPLSPIRNEKQYQRAVGFMQELVDRIGNDEDHPMADLLDAVGSLMHDYEERHHPMPEGTGIHALRFLMKQHHLRQQDMTELGSQGVVSDLLAGRRNLNLRHIKALAKRFHIPPSVFL